MATYDHIADAYDLVYADTGEKVPFVIQKLQHYQAQEILELGSGSGLLAIPLKDEGFKIEGLEISKEMIAVAHQNDPELTVHCGDIRDYDLGKQYDAVLCVSSGLVLLDSHEEMRQCLSRSYAHLKPGGILWLELPNHPVEMQQNHLTQEVHANDDSSIIVVIQSSQEEQYWQENWTIFRQSRDGFAREDVTCREFLYSPSQLEQDLKDSGFDIIETYGDLFGNPFDEELSWRRVCICTKASS